MTDLSHVLATIWLRAAGLLFVFWWVIAIAVPVVFLSLARNVAKSRRALERIAAALEASGGAGGRGVLGL